MSTSRTLLPIHCKSFSYKLEFKARDIVKEKSMQDTINHVGGFL